MEKLQNWLTAILAGLVSKPEFLSVNILQDEQGVLFTVDVADEDRGKVIGTKGTIAEAMRTLLRASGHLSDVRASLKINSPGSNFTPRHD